MSSTNQRESETYHSSLGPVNITSFDSMQEIAIHENSNSSSTRHHRPATLPLEPTLGTSVHSNDIINSSSIITANLASKHTPIDALKEWSLSTFKCTKQMLNEKLGKCTRTVDVELENEIEKLRDTQHKYESILKLSRDMGNQYATIIVQQNAMYEHLNELAMRETKSSLSSADNFERHNTLSGDFKQNAEMMRSIAKNGEKLLMALKFFISNLSTLVYKTIEDTIVTIRAFEAARLEYDAERNNINSIVCTTAGQSSNSNTNITSDKVNHTKIKYEKLREDVLIKMKFLDENKAKVMHKQLVLFHNAFAAFASGNATALDSTLKQFSIRPQNASFLEK
ncbi:Arfaptin-1 [Blomia tropicalis]|nr:Arfaptin-1 [Blomia tropicalis]